MPCIGLKMATNVLPDHSLRDKFCVSSTWILGGLLDSFDQLNMMAVTGWYILAPGLRRLTFHLSLGTFPLRIQPPFHEEGQERQWHMAENGEPAPPPTDNSSVELPNLPTKRASHLGSGSARGPAEVLWAKAGQGGGRNCSRWAIYSQTSVRVCEQNKTISCHCICCNNRITSTYFHHQKEHPFLAILVTCVCLYYLYTYPVTDIL